MKIPMREPDDRRRSDRVPTDLAVEVVLQDGSVFKGVLRDMSIDGMRVEVLGSEALPEEEVKIRIFLPGGEEIHLSGKMVWRKETNGGLSFGLTGLRVFEEDRDKFFEFLSDSFLNLFLSMVANGE